MSGVVPVVFDFDGSLALARSLWSVADDLDALRVQRGGLADDALVDWLGVFADDFTLRADNEDATATFLVEQLRAEAQGWAVEWQKAMDQENWNRYTLAVERVKADRDWKDDLGGWLFGHDDLPPTPAAAAVPASPSFTATRSFANYSGY